MCAEAQPNFMSAKEPCQIFLLGTKFSRNDKYGRYLNPLSELLECCSAIFLLVLDIYLLEDTI